MVDSKSKRRVIIDTDPGVDDALTIFAALRCDAIEVIGLTTIFGNVPTVKSTQNALGLLELAGRNDVPVAKGSDCTFTGDPKTRIADFVHGNDGLGNTGELEASRDPLPISASEFIRDACSKHPGEVTILALGPLTNIAIALREAEAANEDLGLNGVRVVLLGGAFNVNGNVNPCSEANIFCDPEAADRVFGSRLDVSVIPLDVTCQCLFSSMDLDLLEREGGKIGEYCSAISQFYKNFHHEAYNCNGLMLHDPTALVAIFRPELFWFKRGAVVVGCEGALRGQTVMDENKKNWRGDNAWTQRREASVALEVDERAVVDCVRALLLAWGD